jgi:hypothetical protein
VKRRDLNFLLLGILFALLFFGFNTPLLYRFRITYSIPASWPEFLTAIGTIATSIIAVVLALRDYFYKPNMKLINNRENIQRSANVAQGHTRLEFINDGNGTGKNVNVYIEHIIDNDIPRPDFLPVPLSWTHDGRYFRNFPPKEIWFLDLCRKENVNNNQFPHLVLAAGEGVKNYEALYPGKTILQLKISDESGRIRRYKIVLIWQKGDPYVRVKSKSEISKT